MQYREAIIFTRVGLEGEMLTRTGLMEGILITGGSSGHGLRWNGDLKEVISMHCRGYLLVRQAVLETVTGPVFAQISAENLWMWEDSIPILRETGVIRVYHSVVESRTIDITIRLEALKDSITIATRGPTAMGHSTPGCKHLRCRRYHISQMIRDQNPAGHGLTSAVYSWEAVKHQA